MLDEFGKIAVAEIVFYAPVLCVAFFVGMRGGLRRGEAWFFLLTFSVVRILGAVLSIISKTESHPSIGILTAVGILQSLGLSPLLLATLGFVTKIANHGLPSFTRALHILHLVFIGGVVLAIFGGTKQSPDNPTSEQNTGHTLSRVGVIFFLVGYVALFGIHILLWGVRESIPTNHRKFLTSLSCALPFLAIRVLYSILGAFVTPIPSQWSSTAGNWRLYLVMGLIMEYIVVCIYVITGAITPLHQEDEQRVRGQAGVYASNNGLLELGNKQYYPVRPYD